MLLKKNWLSYVLWLLYTILLAYLSTVFVYAAVVGVFHLSRQMAIGAVILFFLLTAGAYFGGRQLLVLRSRIRKRKVSRAYAWEHFFWVIICLSAIVYRVYLVSVYTVEMTQEDVFYRVAMTRGGFGTPFLMHGATEAYTYLLSVLFSVFGVKLFYGVILQAVFLTIAMILLFFAIKILAGRIPAFAALLFLSFSQFSVRTIYSLSPTAIYMLFYALALLLIARYLNKERKKGSAGRGLKAPILLGVFIGALFYLDLLGITLLIFGAMIFGVKWRRLEAIEPGERELRKKEELKKSLHQFLVMAGSTLGAFLILAFLDSFRHGVNVFVLLGKLTMEYANRMSLQYNFTGVTALFGTAFCFVSMLLVYGFWMHKRQKGSPWMALLLLGCGIKFLGVTLLDYNFILSVAIAVLSGIGLKSLSPEKIPVLPENKPEDITEEVPEYITENITENIPVQVEPVVEAMPVPETMPVPEAAPETEAIPVQETLPVQETAPETEAIPIQETAPVAEAIPVQVAAPETSNIPVQESATPVQEAAPEPEQMIEEVRKETVTEEKKPAMIPNPLPLPKKHEKRTMDYDRKTVEDDFDFDSAEDDDFDL